MSNETESANRLSPLAKKLIAAGIAVLLFIIGSSMFLLHKVGEASKKSVELQGMFEASSAAFDPQKQSHLLNAEMAYFEAQKCQSNKDYSGMHKAYAEAVESFNSCLGAKSSFLYIVLMEQGQGECEFNKWKEAESAFRRALEGQSLDFENNQERVFKARFWLAYALRNQSQFDPVYKMLVQTVEEAEEYEKNSKDQKWLRSALDELGHCYYQGGKYDDAERQYLRVLALAERQAPKEVADSLLWLAEAKLGQKKYDDAIVYCNRVIKEDPQESRGFKTRAEVYYDAEKLDLALADYNRAIELKPRSSTLYEDRGDTYSEMDNLEKAIADYSKAISLDALNKSAIEKRAELYEELGKTAESK